MPVRRSRSSSAAEARLPQHTEVELTPSITKKIAMLPELKRQRIAEEPTVMKQSASQTDLNALSVLNSNSSTVLPIRVSKEDQALPAPKKNLEYIIRNHSSVMPVSHLHESAENRVRVAASNTTDRPTDSDRKGGLTDLTTNAGEAAIIKPSLITDDINSRLEGLRQFREWGNRIHANAKAQENPTSAAKIEAAGVPVQEVPALCIRLEDSNTQSRPVSVESKIELSTGSAPTPFSSPEITPVPFAQNCPDKEVCSASLPDLDTQKSSLLDPECQDMSRSQSRTVVISSSLPNAQPVSRSKSRSPSRGITSRHVVDQSNACARSHPPVSFPKDFYERFANAETPTAPTDGKLTSNVNGVQSTPRVSPKTVAVSSKSASLVEDNIDPLPTPCDKRGRPTFYTTVHYFTECPHASPPANRPLDPKAQPRTDPNFHSFTTDIVRSVIPGACFNCDVAQRRSRENTIVDANTADLAQLTTELTGLLDQLELDSSEDEEHSYLHDKHSARLLTSSTFREDKHDIDLETEGIKKLPPLSDDPDIPSTHRLGKVTTKDQRSFQQRIVKQIRNTEAQLDKLRNEQDDQVKRVWRGFTPRWGPATLGVQRSGQWKGARSNAIIRSNSTTSAHVTQTVAQLVDDVQVVKTEDGNNNGQDHATATPRGRSLHKDNQSSTRTSSAVSARDMPGSRSPGDGRMRVGWIREDRK